VAVFVLALLRQAGVQILIGTDGFNQIFTEAEHLVRENGLSPHAVATMVFETGPVLFPERRIGCFEPGCEADFLVLEADPTADISALRLNNQANERNASMMADDTGITSPTPCVAFSAPGP